MNHVVNVIPFHFLRLWFYTKVPRFDIKPGAAVFLCVTFDTVGKLSIRENSVINERCRIDTRGGVEIGANVSISADVIILTGDHDVDSPDLSGRTRRVKIDDRVWIGTRAMILPGVHLGEGCVVGAGAVVTRDVAPFDVVAGVPARKIKSRSPKSVEYCSSYRRMFH